jgi:hypothetical protein
LLAAIQTYLRNAQDLLAATNNLSALNGAIAFGYSALANEQALDAGTKGFSQFVTNLESSGRIRHDLASQLRTLSTSAESEIAAGQFDVAIASLDLASSLIRNAGSGSLAADVASDLLLYTQTVRSAIPAAGSGPTMDHSTVPTAAGGGPMLVNFQRLGTSARSTRLVLTFSGVLNPSAAQNPANYRIIATGPDGRFDTRDDLVIPIESAAYEPVGHAVTLTASRRLSWSDRYEIWVNGSSPAGVTDLAGNLLDGNNDGKPGDDYLAAFRGTVLISPPSPSGFGKGRDAFVTSLYNEVLGRAPEPAGLFFWSKHLASKMKPEAVATSFWVSRERRILLSEHKAPPIRFGRALSDANKAWKQAMEVRAPDPTGRANTKHSAGDSGPVRAKFCGREWGPIRGVKIAPNTLP